MRFLYIDAENIGLKELEIISASITDKVLVFSKNEAVKEVCERKLFLYISSYPCGPNQADFYIIGNLVGMIASLTEQQREACQFVLYSRDNPLVAAFEFQCVLHKVKHSTALEPKSCQAQVKAQSKIVSELETTAKTTDLSKTNTAKHSIEAIAQRIYQHFKTAQKIETVRAKLKLEKPEFSRALDKLIKAKKIQRSSQGKNTWVRTN